MGGEAVEKGLVVMERSRVGQEVGGGSDGTNMKCAAKDAV